MRANTTTWNVFANWNHAEGTAIYTQQHLIIMMANFWGTHASISLNDSYVFHMVFDIYMVLYYY